jgi:hypothetical protein
MAQSEKRKPGILLPPAVGYSMQILINLVKANKIPPKYYPRLLAITLINLINWPFRTYERTLINPKYRKAGINEDPVFILGHWRSGTTHLHNLLCQDPQMGYTTTFQSVFPDTLFNIAGRFIFKNFTKLLIPGKRKGDNVKLDPSLPQEEEFALGDKTPVCFYYFWMFPQQILKYYDSFIRFNQIPEKDFIAWKNDYKLLITKSLKNTGRQRFLSKNPTNTGRIKVLLEIFPNAKFIHIHRNPVEVFLSMRNFFDKMLPPLQLQSISQKELDDHTFTIYKNIMADYFGQKQLIPAGNLVEISFDELEKDPEIILKNIYSKLNLDGFEKAGPLFKSYLHNMGTYTKNKHYISKSQLKRIQDEWGFAMEKLNYSTPENIEVTDG